MHWTTLVSEMGLFLEYWGQLWPIFIHNSTSQHSAETEPNWLSRSQLLRPLIHGYRYSHCSSPQLLQAGLGPPRQKLWENIGADLYRSDALPLTNPTMSKHWISSNILFNKTTDSQPCKTPSCMKRGLYVGKNGALSLTSTTCILTIAVPYLCLDPGLYARTWNKDRTRCLL